MASDTAWGAEDGGKLALQLALRALEWDSAGAASRLNLAHVLARREDPAAREVFEEVLRMPMAGPEEQGMAEHGLKSLAESSDRTVEDR